MSQYTEHEELEAVLATQELLAFESVDKSECLGDEFDKSARQSKSLPQWTKLSKEKENSKENSIKNHVVSKRLSSQGWIPKHTNWTLGVSISPF